MNCDFAKSMHNNLAFENTVLTQCMLGSEFSKYFFLNFDRFS